MNKRFAFLEHGSYMEETSKMLSTVGINGIWKYTEKIPSWRDVDLNK